MNNKCVLGAFFLHQNSNILLIWTIWMTILIQQVYIFLFCSIKFGYFSFHLYFGFYFCKGTFKMCFCFWSYLGANLMVSQPENIKKFKLNAEECFISLVFLYKFCDITCFVLFRAVNYNIDSIKIFLWPNLVVID